MRDEIACVGIVHGALSRVFPRVVGGIIIREHADDVDVLDVFECVLCRVNKFAAKDEVQALGHFKAFIVGLGFAVAYAFVSAVSSKLRKQRLMNPATGNQSV